jgi:hypothetical protein
MRHRARPGNVAIRHDVLRCASVLGEFDAHRPLGGLAKWHRLPIGCRTVAGPSSESGSLAVPPSPRLGASGPIPSCPHTRARGHVRRSILTPRSLRGRVRGVSHRLAGDGETTPREPGQVTLSSDTLRTLSPSAREPFRNVLIRDQADRDAISSTLMRYRDQNGQDWPTSSTDAEAPWHASTWQQ